MIKSMTGFGRYEKVTEEYKMIVELKSVNHRYCDISLKMPKKLNPFEAMIRTMLKNHIGRGKVDVYITYEDYSEDHVSVKYNHDVAKSYIESLQAISNDFGLSADLSAVVLSRYPEVISLEEQPEDQNKVEVRIREAVEKACLQFVDSRSLEGEHLKKDLIDKLETITGYVDYIVNRSPEVINEYREKISNKVQELLGNIQLEESVIATEITVYADKMCVDEEMVRLKSHIHTMKKVLETGGCIGRKLDFIAQELNREANTTLSKSSDISISNVAIDLKTEIEKIREQIQNIE